MKTFRVQMILTTTSSGLDELTVKALKRKLYEQAIGLIGISMEHIEIEEISADADPESAPFYIGHDFGSAGK